MVHRVNVTGENDRPKLYEYHNRLCIAKDKQDAAAVFGISKHRSKEINFLQVEYPDYWAGYERK